MSAFEGTPLTLALRDCGILSVAIVGIPTEIGIEPTARHAADLCIIPVIIADACGASDEAAAQRSLESLHFAGDAIVSASKHSPTSWNRVKAARRTSKV
jgi:biuret amidohydrolase